MYVKNVFIATFLISFCCDLEVIMRKMPLALFGLRVNHLASGKELQNLYICFLVSLFPVIGPASVKMKLPYLLN